MSAISQLSVAHPLLRNMAIGAHVVLAAWLLINGVGHQAHVLWKAYAGTLRPDAEVSSLLAVGAGLMIVGALVSFSIAPLARLLAPSVTPALLAAGALAFVIVGIALKYGTTFLGGTIAVGLLDVGLLVAHAALNAPGALKTPSPLLWP
jgi:hypothetical protein